MQDTMYKQCCLRRETDTGYEETTSWLPEQFAVVGKILRLRDEKTGEWSSGWRVQFAGTNRLLYMQISRGQHRFGLANKVEEW